MFKLHELLYLLPEDKIIKIGTEEGDGWDYIYYNTPEAIGALLPEDYLDKGIVETCDSAVNPDALMIIIEGAPIRTQKNKHNGFWRMSEFIKAFGLERVEA